MENIKDIYNKLNSELKAQLADIKLLLLDFDGVLTDNTVIHSQDGIESVIRSRADSFGIDMLYDAGLYNKANYQDNNHEVDIVILSRETNPVVASVAGKIKVKCTQSQYDKFGAFKEEIEKRSLKPEQVLFIGNDYNDLECIKAAGIGVAVADAYQLVKDAADYVTQAKGGCGAFREICELILLAKAKHPYIK